MMIDAAIPASGPLPRQGTSRIVRPGEGETLAGDGGRFLLTSAETGGRLLLGEGETAAGSGPPLHVHTREDEVFLLQSGHCDFDLDGERVTVGPGAVVWGPRGVPHTFRALDDAPVHLLSAVLPGGGFENYHRRFVLEIATGAPVLGNIVRMNREFGITFLAPESVADQRATRAGGTAAAEKPKVVRPGEGEVREANGDRVRFLLSSEDTNGRCALIELETPPGGGSEMHGHTHEDEVFLVQSGRYAFHLGDERHEAGPGAVVYGARPGPHGFRVVGDVPGRMLVLFLPGGFERYFRRMLEASVHGRPADPRLVAQISKEHGLVLPKRA